MIIRTDIAASVLVMLLAVGCSAPQASPPAPELGSVRPPLSSAAKRAAAPPTGLAAIEPCDLLTAQEADSLGLRPQGKGEKNFGLRRCSWNTPDGDGLSTGINDHRGISELNFADASSVTDVTIGRHQAKRALDGIGRGYCDINFAIGDTANVSVLALFVKDTPRACAVADRAAVLVESKLP